jgi:hypothetical protein
MKRQALVGIRKRVIAILPDLDVNLGVLGDDELVVTHYSLTGGVTGDFKIKKNDLRFSRPADLG